MDECSCAPAEPVVEVGADAFRCPRSGNIHKRGRGCSPKCPCVTCLAKPRRDDGAHADERTTCPRCKKLMRTKVTVDTCPCWNCARRRQRLYRFREEDRGATDRLNQATAAFYADQFRQSGPHRQRRGLAGAR